MKRLYSLFLIAVLFGCTLRAQVITITFEGTLNGASIPLDSILVMNLTAGGDTTIYFPDNVLVLDGSTGLQAIAAQAPGLRPLANPFAGGTEVMVSATGGALLLSLHDALGRVLASLASSVAPGVYRFRVNCDRPGVHLLTAVQGGVRRSVRLLASEGGGAMGLALLGGADGGAAKEDRSLFTWVTGDELQYIGHTTVASVVRGYSLQDIPAFTGIRSFLWQGACSGAPTVTDVNGNTYSTIQIGGQCWTADNLRASTYANGDPIPNVTDNTSWEQMTTGAWAHYENSASYENPYGKLYNWYAVADPRNVCPTGWHVPTNAEWITLVDFLHPNSPSHTEENDYYSWVASKKMKIADGQFWQEPPPPMCATNESGFSGLPGGGRQYGNGLFYDLGGLGYWWSVSERGAEDAWGRFMNNGPLTYISGFGGNKRSGYSVRCVRD